MTQLPSIQRVLLESVASVDPEGRFVEVDGIYTYYKIAIPRIHQQQQFIPDEPNKPVILLLHHLFGNLYTWRYQMQPLADQTGCHVIAYDRPAFGFTERPTQWEKEKNPYTQLASVDFAIQLVFNLGYSGKKIAIVGVSTGAAIACAATMKYPNLIHSLALLGPSMTPDDQGPPGQIGRQILGTAPGRLYLKATLYQSLPLAKLYHDRSSVPDFETKVRPSYQVPLTLPNFYEAISWIMKYFIALEVLPNKKLFTHIPILYLVGNGDKFLPIDNHKRIYDEIASVVPQNGRIEFGVIDSCGHLPQEEKPQETLNCVVDFLSRIGI